MSTCKQTKLQSYRRHVPKHEKTKYVIFIYYAISETISDVSDEAKIPAEFKHITKQRKRN